MVMVVGPGAVMDHWGSLHFFLQHPNGGGCVRRPEGGGAAMTHELPYIHCCFELLAVYGRPKDETTDSA